MQDAGTIAEVSEVAPAYPQTIAPVESAEYLRDSSASVNRPYRSDGVNQPAHETAQYYGNEPALPTAAAEPAQSATEPAAPDLLDDDSGRFEAVSSAKLAEPVPVPTFGATQPGKAHAPKKRRHILRNTLFVLLALGAVAFALYQSGLGARLWQSVFPTSANSGVPSVFGQSPAGKEGVAATIAPATEVGTPELRSASVDPAQAKAPAQLVFKLETNTATSAILLLTEQNTTLHTTAYGTPRGDGLLWQVTADMQEPYSGKVRIFLRDEAGAWSESATTCAVDVQ